MFMLSVLILVSSAAQATHRSSAWAVRAYVVGVVASTLADSASGHPDFCGAVVDRTWLAIAPLARGVWTRKSQL